MILGISEMMGRGKSSPIHRTYGKDIKLGRQESVTIHRSGDLSWLSDPITSPPVEFKLVQFYTKKQLFKLKRKEKKAGRYCQQCRRVNIYGYREDNSKIYSHEPLINCCHRTYYCDDACQQEHYSVHKSSCLTIRNRDREIRKRLPLPDDVAYIVFEYSSTYYRNRYTKNSGRPSQI